MIKTLNLSEEEYRGIPLPSYSLLKKLDDSGPRSINRKYKMESEAIDFGSLLDCRLFTPHEVTNKFYFESVEKPTKQILELADEVIRRSAEDMNIDFYIHNNEEVLAVADELNLFGSTKDPVKRINQFNTDLFWNYLQSKHNSQGKTVFTPDTETECLEAEHIIKTHVKTAHLFQDTEGIETFTQLIIVTLINGQSVKGMLDMVKVNHKRKTITPYDLKATEFRQINFPPHFRKMKYYLQASLYTILLQDYFYDLIQSGYVLENFRFIVYSRSDRYPFIWIVSDQWFKDGLNGFTTANNEYHKGIYDLLNDYKYYLENDFYEIEKCFVLNESLEL